MMSQRFQAEAFGDVLLLEDTEQGHAWERDGAGVWRRVVPQAQAPVRRVALLLAAPGASVLRVVQELRLHREPWELLLSRAVVAARGGLGVPARQVDVLARGVRSRMKSTEGQGHRLVLEVAVPRLVALSYQLDARMVEARLGVWQARRRAASARAVPVGWRRAVAGPCPRPELLAVVGGVLGRERPGQRWLVVPVRR